VDSNHDRQSQNLPSCRLDDLPMFKAAGGNRTHILPLTRRLLHPLSYDGVFKSE
jgi:hypothetical protein